MINRHLDLGCGTVARNPFQADELWGCDLVNLGQQAESQNFTFIEADLTRPPLPFENEFFASVSAFDVIEHIPRTGYLGNKPFSPFIELMNEIHRVLCNGGKFLASTPVYPHPAVFQDPTHVNFITDQTHDYFCGPEPYARRYGFKGEFLAERVCREPQKNLHDHTSSDLRKRYRTFEKKYLKGGLSHITWKLIAIKND